MSLLTKLIIIIYLSLISLLAVALTVADKQNAAKNRRRVSEKTLFITAFLGGSVAEYITMRLIHHKTLHKRFMLGLPAIIIIQAGAAIFFFLRDSGLF